jgi:sigma-B regulation protein RsbU (phosphoserine phosphatase)
MTQLYHQLRLRLSQAGLWPSSKLAMIACYLMGLDLLLFGLEKLFGLLKLSYGDSLTGWVGFLDFVVSVLCVILAFRWLKARMLWRLRNRLIVTYVFIGFIPLILLVSLALGSFYLFAGQFATFIVTTGLNSEISSLSAANSAIAHRLAAESQGRPAGWEVSLSTLRQADKLWADRQICVWLNGKLVLNSSPVEIAATAPDLPPYVKSPFRGVVRDHAKLFLRVLDAVPLKEGNLTVLSSEPFPQLLQNLAASLGEITLYEGLSLNKVDRTDPGPVRGTQVLAGDNKKVVLDTSKAKLMSTWGAIPSPTAALDRSVVFPTSIPVTDWGKGENTNPVAITVQTRISKLYERLFAAQGAFAPTVEVFLLFAVIVFAVIELIAIWIGTELTRTVTGAVAQLYDGTMHINQGDFSHRIAVKSRDQVATLATSFNSMTASIQRLIEEQKQKQRLENELTIAKEVQEQLFPQGNVQLASLEVHGFFRPARTVSGDYYDFLTLDSDRLVLAVGDISGKGISAALLMATIHSAVRAYSLQDIPMLREPVLREPAIVGAAVGSDIVLASATRALDVSPGALLQLLNHQLYESTPPEKYATLFLGIYNGAERKFTYSNGGHLPPIIMSQDGSIRRLECGGTVVGLFDQASYEEESVALRSGEILLAYTDGVTEPENEFGEFGEQRLIDLVRENRDLPLPRITEIVTAAVDDWIGADEQPDDVTLVLARAR